MSFATNDLTVTRDNHVRSLGLQRIVDRDRAIILDLREKLARAEQERDEAMRQLQDIVSLVDSPDPK